MGLMDKIAGRVKKTAGEMTDDEKVRREGALQERKGEAQDELERHQEDANRKAEE
ncbi:MAG: CsbD family protein, partial [Solirubrobacteraceae bacterium]